MSSTQPQVSIIAINYNSLDDTLEFLQSTRKLTYPNVEVILVDNASKTKPGDVIRERFPEVKFIQSETNLGFAGGNNLGVRAAKGDYLFFINNDTLLPENFLEPVMSFMQEHPEAGMASTKVLYPDGKTIQYAGAIGISAITGRGKRLGLFEQDNGQYDRCYKTDLGHGASLIVPRKVVETVGAMPEIFFLYYEEHDWCEHVKRAGYTMYYIGTSHLLHKESVSTGKESPLKVYYMTRNRLLFMRRNFSGIPYLLGVLFFTCVSTPKHTVRYIVKGNFALLKAYYRGLLWNVTHNRN